MKKRTWFSSGVPISAVTLSHSFLTLVDFWQTFSKAVLYSSAEEFSCTHCMYVCKTHDLEVEKVSLASYACKHMHTHRECKSSHLLIVTWHLTPNQPCLTYQSLSTLARVCHENIGLLCLRLQWTFKISNIVCLDNIFWTTEPFVIKLGSVIIIISQSAVFRAKVTVGACVIKIWLCLLYLLNIRSFCYQTLFGGTSS